MAIKITLKNSVVQDSVPTTTHLAAVGELALNANINSLGIYMRASDNSIVKMAGPGSVTTPAASTTAAGIAELATSAETTTGTDTARVTTPAGVKAVTDAERTTSNNTYLALAGGTLTGVVAATAGSNSAPAIHFGDSDSGIFGGTNTVSLTAGGTERLKADANGIGIGTSGTSGFPLSILSAASTGQAIVLVGDATNEESKIYFRNNANDANKAWIQNDGAELDLVAGFGGALSFQINSSEKARVDSSGRLLVGLTSARTLNSGYTPSLQVEGNTATTSSISAINNVNQTGGPSVWLGKSRGAALGGVTTVQTGDELGSIFFNGADGTDIQSIGASIVAKSNGTVAGNRMPGELVFATTADSAGSVAPTTALTLTSSQNAVFAGNIGIGCSPSKELHVKGVDVALRLESTAATGRIGTEFYDTSAQKGFFGYPSSGNDNMCIQQNENADFYIDVNGSTRMLIDSSGLVGIGTDSPTGIHSLAKVLEISGGDGGDLIIGNSVSTNVGAGAHMGAVAFKNIDSATGSPHYAGIRCEAVDASGNMDLRFYTGNGNLEADTPQVIMTGDSVGISVTAPASPLHAKGISTTIGIHDYPQLTLETASTDGAADKGSGIMFLNHDGNSGKFGGNIRVLNENATSGNHASYMSFSTRPAGGSVTEGIRITSTGQLIQYGQLGVADGSADDLVIGDTTGSVNRGMTIYSHNAQNGSIAFADNDSNYRGAIQYMHNGDRFRILTGGQETLRLQSGGTDGVCTFFMGGVTNNHNKTGALTLNHYTFNTYNQIDLIKGSTTSGSNLIEIGGSGSAAGPTAATEIKLFTAANAVTNNGTERLRVASDGVIHVNSSDSASGGRISAGGSAIYIQSGNGRQGLTINDAASGVNRQWQITTAGNLKAPEVGTGIDFGINADGGVTTPGEILTDYEQGAWTPSVTAGAPSTGYSVQYGRYTKVGNLVTIWFYFALDGTSTVDNSHFTVSGLPYTSTSTMYSGLSGYNNLSASSFTSMRPIIFPGTATIKWYFQGGTGVSNASGSNLGATAQQLWWGSYQTS